MPQSVSRRQLLQGAAGTAAVGLAGVTPALAAPIPIKIANASKVRWDTGRWRRC